MKGNCYMTWRQIQNKPTNKIFQKNIGEMLT